MNNTELKRPTDKSGTPLPIRLGPPNKVKGPSILARIHAATTVAEVDGVMADIMKIGGAPQKAVRRWVLAAAYRKVAITAPPPPPKPKPVADASKGKKPK